MSNLLIYRNKKKITLGFALELKPKFICSFKFTGFLQFILSHEKNVILYFNNFKLHAVWADLKYAHYSIFRRHLSRDY